MLGQHEYQDQVCISKRCLAIESFRCVKNSSDYPKAAANEASEILVT